MRTLIVVPVTAADGRPLLLVTVGTEDRRFDRLVRWTDAWLAAGGVLLRCLMQIGTSAPRTGPAEQATASAGGRRQRGDDGH